MSIGPTSGAGAALPSFESGGFPAAPAPTAQAPAPAVSRAATSTRPAPGAAAVGQVAGAAPARGPEETVRAFYDAFTHLRFDEVAGVYAKDVRYKDPLFEHKDAASTIHMWRTLFQADDLRMGFQVLGVEGDVVRGRWTADYKFHGRPVHEVSESRFTVRDGRIVAHEDSFSTVAWAKQALPLGPLEPFADTTLGRAVITRLMRFGITLAEGQLRKKEQG